MESKDERLPSEQPQPAEPPVPKKRFRIEKLEERVAPSTHYNPHSKLVGSGGGGDSSASSGLSGSGSIY